MGEISEVFLTVISGTLVYVLGRLLTKLFIEPVHDLNKCIGQINNKLIYYANKYTNPKIKSQKKTEELSNSLRQLSSQLRAKSNVVKGYWIFKILRFIPSKKSIDIAAKELMFLSNSVYNGDAYKNKESADKIKEALNLI